MYLQCDMTSSPFASSPQQMVSLSLLSSKQLRLSGETGDKAALIDADTADTGRV